MGAVFVCYLPRYFCVSGTSLFRTLPFSLQINIKGDRRGWSPPVDKVIAKSLG